MPSNIVKILPCKTEAKTQQILYLLTMTILHKNASIWFSVSGNGPAIVLLHGFLEDSSMWTDLASVLSKKNKVICIDLLGHGKTDSLSYVHTMEEMADTVLTVLKHLGLRKYTFIGHSMGGYVALAFEKHILKILKGYVY